MLGNVIIHGDDAGITGCYMIGEPGSGTEKLVPVDGVTVFQNYDKIKASLGPGQLFEDPYFPAVKASISNNSEEKDSEIECIDDIEWRRPLEILQEKGIEGNPIFIDNGGDPEKVGNPNDVNENKLDEGRWFRCAMAELSRLPELFWKVVGKENLTQFNPEEYHGIFKFRFAAYGRLTEVVIDDRIPYLRKQASHWSVSATNPRVFWSALMEKAYAKLYSSYQAIRSGWIGDALQDFTGGVIDRHDLEYMYEDAVWKLFGNTNKATFYKGATVMKNFDSDESEKRFVAKTGLANYHTYSVLSAKVLEIRGKERKLFRLRSPWGEAYEFKGKLHAKSGKLWKKLDEETKKEFSAGDHSEFWMTVAEFQDNFRLLEFANLTPFESSENVKLLIDGEWTEENCFGSIAAPTEAKDANDGAENNGAESDDAENNDAESDDAENDDAYVDDDDVDYNALLQRGIDNLSQAIAALEEGGNDDGQLFTGAFKEEDLNTFCKNPQIKFTVPEIDLNEKGKSEVVITIFQRYPLNLEVPAGEYRIGMAVAQVQSAVPVSGTEMFENPSAFQFFYVMDLRQLTVRFTRKPGDYVVIPFNTTKTLGGFTVRVYTRQ